MGNDTKRLLVVALNFAPEQTGIGKYVGDMTEWLTSHGISVRVVTAPPYYPYWSVKPGYSGARYRRENVAGAHVYRCPIWVPRCPCGLTRILHLLSFALSSLPVVLWQALVWRPHLIFVVEPPLGAAPTVRLAAALCGARSWLHVQDFEIDAAFDLGLLRAPRLGRAILAIERWLMRGFDQVSTISESMRSKLRAKGVREDRIVSFPNWVDTGSIRPIEAPIALRAELGIDPGTHVVLYAGNMGEKQGLEIILDVARLFREDPNVLFLLCGDGAARSRIARAAAVLANVRLIPLQPLSRLNELLNLADVHLLPQRKAAEDLVLPSKLTAIMASGHPVVATARRESDVARCAAIGGIVVSPGDVRAIASAVRRLLADDDLRLQLGATGRAYALQNWEREKVLRQVFARLPTLAATAARDDDDDGGTASAPLAIAIPAAVAGPVPATSLTDV
ncbi:MAG TPA: WcaI family glycosyltransferase [Steroidobacteraceae bacterium]|nr:WcaI family glycosyltransferase [Steroidobacteraceae bacterium]